MMRGDNQTISAPTFSPFVPQIPRHLTPIAEHAVPSNVNQQQAAPPPPTSRLFGRRTMTSSDGAGDNPTTSPSGSSRQDRTSANASNNMDNNSSPTSFQFGHNNPEAPSSQQPLLQGVPLTPGNRRASLWLQDRLSPIRDLPTTPPPPRTPPRFSDEYNMNNTSFHFGIINNSHLEHGGLRTRPASPSVGGGGGNSTTAPPGAVFHDSSRRPTTDTSNMSNTAAFHLGPRNSQESLRRNQAANPLSNEVLNELRNLLESSDHESDDEFNIGSTTTVRAESNTENRVVVDGPSVKDLCHDTPTKEGDGKATCVICFDNAQNCIAWPCAHLAFCVKCSRELCFGKDGKETKYRGRLKCPSCRAVVHAMKPVKPQ